MEDLEDLKKKELEENKGELKELVLIIKAILFCSMIAFAIVLIAGVLKSVILGWLG
jgi:hypothetical protein